MSQFPASTVELYNVGGEGQVGIPFAIYPSVLFYKADLFKEAGLAEPPHEWNGKYTMPDGSKVPWDYDTVRKIAHAPDRRQERQGRDRGRLRSGEHRPVGLRAAARRPAPDRRVLEGRHARRRADGKTVQIPDAWVAAWHWFYDGDLEGPHRR